MKYRAGKTFTVGGPEETRHFVDREFDPGFPQMPELSHDEVHATVLTIEEGEVVPGAADFENLTSLVRDGFLVADGAEAAPAGAAATPATRPRKPRKRTAAKRATA